MEDMLVMPSFEAKFNNRFIVRFPEELGIPSWCVGQITKPNYINEDWSDIIIQFRDPVVPSISKIIYDILETKIHGQQNPLKEFNIITLDAGGSEVENWLIIVDEIKIFNFGISAYYDDQIQTVTVYIKPSSCKLLY